MNRDERADWIATLRIGDELMIRSGDTYRFSRLAEVYYNKKLRRNNQTIFMKRLYEAEGGLQFDAQGFGLVGFYCVVMKPDDRIRQRTRAELLMPDLMSLARTATPEAIYRAISVLRDGQKE